MGGADAYNIHVQSIENKRQTMMMEEQPELEQQERGQMQSATFKVRGYTSLLAFVSLTFLCTMVILSPFAILPSPARLIAASRRLESAIVPSGNFIGIKSPEMGHPHLRHELNHKEDDKLVRNMLEKPRLAEQEAKNEIFAEDEQIKWDSSRRLDFIGLRSPEMGHPHLRHELNHKGDDKLVRNMVEKPVLAETEARNEIFAEDEQIKWDMSEEK